VETAAVSEVDIEALSDADIDSLLDGLDEPESSTSSEKAKV
jgi:hypothetical protein